MTLFLAGPTGSGKSAVAVELAEMLDAEIVSSDAVSYTHLDVYKRQVLCLMIFPEFYQ